MAFRPARPRTGRVRCGVRMSRTATRSSVIDEERRARIFELRVRLWGVFTSGAMATFEENAPVLENSRYVAAQPLADHRIERIEVTHHALPLDPPFRAAWDSRPQPILPVSVVRMVSDRGAVGIGTGTSLEGIEKYLDLLVGHDPLDVARHYEVLSNIDFHGCRPWPLDIALWDLAGKIRGEPVWRLLGGNSGRVRCYASTGMLRDRSALADTAAELVDRGFPAIKVRFHRADWRDDIRVLASVRDTVGDSAELLVDCNQGWRMPWDTTPPWTYHQAVVVARELAELGVYWMEEPLHRGNCKGMAALRNAVGLRIAAGEMTREEHALNDLLDWQSVDVLQPDATLTCGITGLTSVAARAARAEVAFTPHTWGNGIGLLANAQLFAGCGGGPWLEYPCDPPEWTPERRDFALAEPVLTDKAGYITLPDTPGLGIELDEDRLEKYRVT